MIAAIAITVVVSQFRSSYVERELSAKTQTEHYVRPMEAHVLSLMFIDAKEIALAASSRTDVLGTSYADRNYSPGDDTAHILGSIGIALDPDAGGDADTLMKHADQAMYSAKQDGRNHYNYYAKPPKVAKTAEN